MDKKWLVKLKDLSAAVQPLGPVAEEGYPVAHGLLAIAERLEAMIERMDELILATRYPHSRDM